MTTFTLNTPPNPDHHNRLARYLAELHRRDAQSPQPPTVTLWDGAQNRFRAVDPANTLDHLHEAARAVGRLNGSNARDARIRRKPRRTPASRWVRWIRQIPSWLPTITFSRAKARQHIAACYLAAARQAAARGDHITAQHAARCCIAMSRVVS